MSMRWSATSLLFAGACALPRAGDSPPATPGAPEVPSDALPATNREAGEVLDATVPGLDGRSLALADLRGRVVVLELTATWVAEWGANAEMYGALLDEAAAAVAVVVVGMDPERAPLEARWDVPPRPGLWRGWDPQGGLAARLQVAKLPTVIVLDREGVIRGVWGGYAPDQWSEVAAAIGRARGDG